MGRQKIKHMSTFTPGPARADNLTWYFDLNPTAQNLKLNCTVFLDSDQLDTHLLYFTVRFEHYMLIIRRLNCTAAASGIVTLCKWPSGAPGGLLLSVTIPSAALVQFTLLMMSV